MGTNYNGPPRSPSSQHLASPPAPPSTESAAERELRMQRINQMNADRERTGQIGDSVLGGVIAGVALGSMLD